MHRAAGPWRPWSILGLCVVLATALAPAQPIARGEVGPRPRYVGGGVYLAPPKVEPGATARPVTINIDTTQPYTTAYGTTISPYVFGSNLDLRGVNPAVFTTTQPPPTITQQLDLAGLRLMRVQLDQQFIVTSTMNAQTDYHKYDWTGFDHMIKLLKANGWEPLICLWQVADYNAPQGIDNHNSAPPVNLAEWGRVSANIVRHANIDNHWGIKYWEIWNEPELDIWYAHRVTGTVYVNMFASAAAQMKAVDPTIWVGGPASSGLFGRKWTMDINKQYEIPLLQNPLSRQNLDFISWHSYMSSTRVGDMVALTRRDIQQYGQGKSIAIFGADEYSSDNSYFSYPSSWNYRGASGTAQYLTGMMQAGSYAAGDWASYNISMTLPYPYTFGYENMVYTTTWQLVPRGFLFQMLSKTLNLPGNRVDASSVSTSTVQVLGASLGVTTTNLVFINGNSTIQPTHVNIRLPQAGRWEGAVNIVGDDSKHDGTGQGKNNVPWEGFVLQTDGSGNYAFEDTIPPWSVLGYKFTYIGS